jgi:hypothetical protein
MTLQKHEFQNKTGEDKNKLLCKKNFYKEAFQISQSFFYDFWPQTEAINLFLDNILSCNKLECFDAVNIDNLVSYFQVRLTPTQVEHLRWTSNT